MTTTFDPSQTPNVQASILDNGGLEIWQRGTSFTFNTASFSTVNVYTADRWSNQAWWASGSPVWTITREASTIHDGTYSLKFNMTALGTTLQDQRMVGQVVENYINFAGKILTFSAWVNTTSAHVNLRLTDGVTTALSSNHPGDGQWHQLSCTLLISNSTTGIQSSMSWDAQVNATTGAHYLDSAMLIVGSNPASFYPTNPQVDLARCQRYFFQAAGNISGEGICNGFVSSASNAQGILRFPVQMRVAPSATVVNTSGFFAYSLTSAVVPSAIAINDITPISSVVSLTLSGMTPGQGTQIMSNATSSYITFSADL